MCTGSIARIVTRAKIKPVSFQALLGHLPRCTIRRPGCAQFGRSSANFRRDAAHPQPTAPSAMALWRRRSASFSYRAPSQAFERLRGDWVSHARYVPLLQDKAVQLMGESPRSTRVARHSASL
jgi:hypothetical protein